MVTLGVTGKLEEWERSGGRILSFQLPGQQKHEFPFWMFARLIQTIFGKLDKWLKIMVKKKESERERKVNFGLCQ